MKRTRPKYLMPVLILAAMTGCQTSPSDRWAIARETLTTAQDAAMILHDARAIDDETLVYRIAPAAQTARTALDRAYVLLPDEPGVEDYLDMAEAAVRRLVAIRTEYVETAP